MKARVMTRAWEIAKQAVVKFGGKAKQYISESLKMAWAELRMPKMAELTGSVKQIAWANDIRDRYIKEFEEDLQTEVYFNGVWTSDVLRSVCGITVALDRVYDIVKETGRSAKEISNEIWENILATNGEARFWINHR